MIKKLNDWYSGLTPLRRFVALVLWILFCMMALRYVIRFVDATFIS